MKHAPFLILAVSLLALSACSGGFFSDEGEEKPLAGDRVSVLELQKTLEPDDDALNAQGFIAPEPWKNDFWPQAGGYPNHAMQNLAFTDQQPKRIWTSDIGQGSEKGFPLTAQPVVADGKVFTLSSALELSAFGVEDGKRLWQIDARKEGEKDPVISGGISFSGGVLFVTSGYDELLAVNPADGKIYWRAKLNAPSRAAPSILDGRVFVSTLSNSVMAFDAKNGSPLWEYSGLTNTEGLLGAPAPAVEGGVVVPAFSSGEVYALRVENGSVAWSDNLAGALRLGGLSGLSDIRGFPVIDKDIVIAVSFAGKLAAIDALSGARVWEKDIGSAQTPWVAGNHLFVLTSSNQIAALGRDTGAIRWVSQLARYKDKESREDPIFWSGPVLAGGRLLAFSSDGRAAEVKAEDGTLIRQWPVGKGVSIPPVIAGGVLYLLSGDGTLAAYQ